MRETLFGSYIRRWRPDGGGEVVLRFKTRRSAENFWELPNLGPVEFQPGWLRRRTK